MKRILLAVLLSLGGNLFALGTVEVEGGFALQSQNEVRIPSTGGTDVSIRQGSLLPFGRVQATLQLAERHELRALWAPYRTAVGIESANAVNFNGSVFAANTPIDVAYQFNSYRLTYRYRISGEGDSLYVAVGATAKIRDAFIRFSQGGVTSINANVGFVPLLHVYFRYRFNDQWEALVDVDGLAAPQGRAIDAYLGARYSPTAGTYVGLGYRGFEGGVSNDTVHNFAWVHYFALTGGIRF